MNYKYILTISLVLTQVACASAKLSCDQKCALDDMWCEGLSRGTAHSTGMGYGVRSRELVTTSGSTTTDAVYCRKPMSGLEAAQIEIDKVSAQEEVESTAQTNWIVAGLALLGLVIGIVAYKN